MRAILLAGVPDVSDRFQAEALGAVQRVLLQRATAAQRIAFRLGYRTAEREVKRPDLHDVNAERFIAEFEYQSIRSLTAETAAKVRLAALQAAREGLTTNEVASVLRGTIDAAEWRVNAIARTEMNRAANWGRYSAWVKSGVVREKEWIATKDARVRPDHLVADGERVPLEAPFTRGAARGVLAPPCAPNCRCAVAPVTDLGLAAAVRLEIQGVLDVEKQHAREMRSVWSGYARMFEHGVTT